VIPVVDGSHRNSDQFGGQDRAAGDFFQIVQQRGNLPLGFRDVFANSKFIHVASWPSKTQQNGTTFHRHESRQSGPD
jgi:hypothetical protein